MPGGRPTKYKPEYCQQIIDHFDVPATYTTDKGEEKACKLPLVIDFAHKIGVNNDTLYEWAKVHPEFSESFKKGRKLQERIWIENSMKGLYNTAFTIFLGKNIFKWTDRQNMAVEGDVKHTHTLGDLGALEKIIDASDDKE